MERLWALQRREAHQCDLFRYHFCPLVFPFAPGLLCMLVPWSAYDPYQNSMRTWLADFNKELEPHGLYVKAFCFKQMRNGGAHWNDGTLATLAFALTSEEARHLQQQPVLQEGNSDDPNWACFCCPAHAHRVV